MYKLLKNVIKHPSPNTNVSTDKPSKKGLLYFSICLTRGRYNKLGAANTSNICKPSACIRCRCVGRPFGQTIKFVLLAPFAWCSAFYTSTKRTAHYCFYCLLRGIKVLPLVAPRGEVRSVFNASALNVIRRRYSLLEVPRRGIHNVIAVAMSIGVAFSNKVMDTPELPQPIKRHVAPKYDICSVGRSMIEMLGVLAIIAVLSVGGIAGYSKAMLMWHSNQQKDLLTELINNAITLKPNLSSIRSKKSLTITNIFAALGAIPEGFTYKNNIIYDLDNNHISITYGIENDRQQDNSTKQVFKYAIRISAIEGTGKLSISMKEYCKNIIQIVQTIPNEVQQVDFSCIDSDSWSGTRGVLIFNKSTIGQTSPAQINDRCNIDIKENGRGYFRILLNPD